MNRTTRRPTAAILRFFCCFLLAVSLLQIPVPGQADNTASLKLAVSSLQQFQSDLGSMRSVVSKPLGPYQIFTQCTWCSEKAWWGFGSCTQHATESRGVGVDFSWTRKMLDGVLKQAEQNVGTFSSSYAPTQEWIDGLPQFSAKFNATADVILGVQREIGAGRGPTTEQQQNVTLAVQTLIDDLSRSSAQLQTGTKSLAAFLQQLSSYQESIKQAIDGADRSAQEALQSVQNQSKNFRCQDGLDQQFVAIRGEFSRSIQEISAAFQKLEASNREAQKGQAVLLGTVVSSQTEMQSVLDLVKAAKDDQLGSFLERLHLNAAKKQWQDLAADYASGKQVKGSDTGGV